VNHPVTGKQNTIMFPEEEETQTAEYLLTQLMTIKGNNKTQNCMGQFQQDSIEPNPKDHTIA
jgi:hypothetical protein